MTSLESISLVLLQLLISNVAKILFTHISGNEVLLCSQSSGLPGFALVIKPSFLQLLGVPVEVLESRNGVVFSEAE